ncbi:vWA domain-containing protein [Riemerella columbipharyngis]|uniref:Ca-activated chloride channel family protein n=1 Tax=Riemerella columbipharyngis TaxID=1071918 RepID=A0A1G6Y2E1_9FLAO|nr:VWA domain-containing protein [Riemerella columbipharyngis]SDD84510.1 Ca-activated chloride channel family protein [Riemerella columbipharyngis]
MNWYLGNYWYILLILLLPLTGALLWSYLKWKKQCRDLFAEQRFRSVLFEKPSSYTKALPALYLLGLLFLIFAMIDLIGGRKHIKVQQKMSNVIFALDVSNSMNAQDIAPNRLTKAKKIVVDVMKKLPNSRVGLVVFAGNAESIMPLTTDFSAIETYIAGIETSIMPHQGTDFLKMMNTAADKFQSIGKNVRNIVLISDGEDNEGHTEQAIKAALDNNIKIISVGVGTPEGAPIPIYVYGQLMGYKTDNNGDVVNSRREETALKEISSETNGAYIDGNTDEAASKIVQQINQINSGTDNYVDSETGIHYYQYFLAVALLVFFIIYLTNPKRDFNI